MKSPAKAHVHRSARRQETAREESRARLLQAKTAVAQAEQMHEIMTKQQRLESRFPRRIEVSATAPAKFGGRSLRRTYVMATLVNLSNPKVVLFYLAFFPQFVTEGGWPMPVQFLLMGAVLIVVGFAVDATVPAYEAATGHALRLLSRLYHRTPFYMPAFAAGLRAERVLPRMCRNFC